MHAHHIISKHVHPAFGIQPHEVDLVPGVALFAKDHINYGNTNLNAITRLIGDRLQYSRVFGPQHAGQVRQRLQEAYQQFGWPDLWRAAEAWLDNRP